MPLPAVFRPLRDPALALLWGGLATSAVGDQLFMVVLTWVAVAVFGTAAGYLNALQAALVLGVALLAGRWADRWQHRRLMVLADLGRAAVMLALAAVWLHLGRPPGWALVAAVVALAAGQALFRPALQAMVPEVVTVRDELPAANALLDTTDRIARLIGPGLAAMLGGILPLVHFVTLNAATFLLSALALTRIGRLRSLPAPAPQPEISVLASALHGFAVLRPFALLRYSLATTGVVFGVWYAAMFLGVPLLLKDSAGDGTAGLAGYGLVIASYGSTNLLATFVVGSMAVPRRPAGMIFGGLGLIGFGGVLMGLAGRWITGPWLLPALCITAAIGAPGGPMEDVAVAVLRQTRVPAHEQAAVMRAFLVNSNLGLLVAFLFAPRVFDAVGAAAAVTGAGAVLVVVAAVGFFGYRRAEG